MSNEKYEDNCITSKIFTVDLLSEKKKKIEGEVPMYYVENSHPAIISKDVIEYVQSEIRVRTKREGYNTNDELLG